MNPTDDKRWIVEEEIDVALKTLANVQPPAGMAARIDRNAQRATAAESASRTARLWWVRTACIAAGIVVVAVFLDAHMRNGKRASTPEIATLAKNAASPRFAAVPAVSVSARPISANAPHLKNVSAPHTRRFPHPRPRTQYRHAANLFNYPLTQQEKLLIRFAQTATPAELQMLNPEYQAKIEAQQEAAFEAYIHSGENRGAQGTQVAANNQATQE